MVKRMNEINHKLLPGVRERIKETNNTIKANKITN